MDMSLNKLLEIVKEPGVLQSMGSQRVRHDLVTEQQCVVQQKLTNSCRSIILSKQTHRKRDQRAGVVGRDDWMKVVTKYKLPVINKY